MPDQPRAPLFVDILRRPPLNTGFVENTFPVPATPNPQLSAANAVPRDPTFTPYFRRYPQQPQVLRPEGAPALAPQVTLPFNQFDWQNPTRRIGLDNSQAGESVSFFDTPPFIPRETAQIVTRPLPRYAECAGFLLTVPPGIQILPPPPGQRDWPNPVRLAWRDTAYAYTGTPVPNLIPPPVTPTPDVTPTDTHDPGPIDSHKRKRRDSPRDLTAKRVDRLRDIALDADAQEREAIRAALEGRTAVTEAADESPAVEALEAALEALAGSDEYGEVLSALEALDGADRAELLALIQELVTLLNSLDLE